MYGATAAPGAGTTNSNAWKNFFIIIPSIDRVCGSDDQEKRLDFLHGSVRRYKPLISSTNCGCGHLMTQFVEIAIAQQFIVITFTQPGGTAVIL